MLCATGASDSSVRVWDVSKGYCTHSFKDHSGVIRQVCFHPDQGRLLLLSASEDATCRVYSLADSRCEGVMGEHMSAPTGIAFSNDGDVAVTCGRDKVPPL